MATDLIRYDLLVQDALKSVVRRVLEDTRRIGLPGEHYFYITFRTKAGGVRLSDRMRERYPDEMTIVLQHQFWDLSISDHAFEVGLSFSGVPERLLIPFDALTGFFDPSVPFSVKFEVQDQVAEPEATELDNGTIALAKPPANLPKPSASLPKPVDAPSPKLAAVESGGKPKATSAGSPRDDAKKTADAEAPVSDAKVVSIDSFRKKP